MASFSRSDWSLVLLLAAINFTHMVDFVIVMPLGKRLMDELGITEGQFGHIVSAYGIAAALAGLAFATVADRFDRKRSLLAMYAGFTVATLACGLARTYPEMLIARFAAGAFGGVAASGLLAIVGDHFDDRRRGTATGILMSSFAFASIVGLPVGLELANRYGRGAPFVAVAALAVPILVAVAWRLPAFRTHINREKGQAIRRLWNAAVEPVHLRSFVFMFFLVLGSFTIIPFIAPYLEANAGRSQEDIPKIYFVAGLFTLVSTMLVGRLSDRLGKRRVFVVMALGSMAMTVLMTNLPGVGLVMTTVVTTFFMIFASGRVVPAQAMMLGAADPAMRGAFTSLNSAVSHVGTGLAPLIGGLFLGRDGDGRMTGYGISGLAAVIFATIAIGLAFRVGRPTATTAKPPPTQEAA
jgi:predicted MFS family arabinose efflux permease